MDSHPGWLERKMAEHYRRVELRKDEREEELRMSWEYHRHDPPHRSSWRDAIGFIVGMVIIIGAISLAISFLDHFLGWLASPSRLSRPY